MFNQIGKVIHYVVDWACFSMQRKDGPHLNPAQHHPIGEQLACQTRQGSDPAMEYAPQTMHGWKPGRKTVWLLEEDFDVFAVFFIEDINDLADFTRVQPGV